jgi:cytochrome c-type biogenesis protein CcmH
VTARIALVAGVALVAVALAIAAAPRSETQGERVARLASELRCPVCQGLSVEDSPSDTAREMRALVEQRVAQGRTDEQIRSEFRQAYGEWIFLSPPLLDPRGLVWVLPLAAILAGAALVATRLGRAPPATALSPDQLAVLRERARLEDATE